MQFTTLHISVHNSLAQSDPRSHRQPVLDPASRTRHGVVDAPGRWRTARSGTPAFCARAPPSGGSTLPAAAAIHLLPTLSYTRPLALLHGSEVLSAILSLFTQSTAGREPRLRPAGAHAEIQQSSSLFCAMLLSCEAIVQNSNRGAIRSRDLDSNAAYPQSLQYSEEGPGVLLRAISGASLLHGTKSSALPMPGVTPGMER